MLKIKNQQQSGFSLLETVIALALGVLLTAMIIAVVVPGIKQIRSVKRTERLHASAVFLLDNFSYWIKQANDLQVSNSSLEIFLPDNSSKTIKQEDNDIKIDNVSFTDSGLIAKELVFTNTPYSVRIEITLGFEHQKEELSILTTVAKRN